MLNISFNNTKHNFNYFLLRIQKDEKKMILGENRLVDRLLCDSLNSLVEENCVVPLHKY